MKFSFRPSIRLPFREKGRILYIIVIKIYDTFRQGVTVLIETTRKNQLNFKEDVPFLCVMGIAVACLGWVIENVLRMIAVGVLDCRYHLLPFISPYGITVFAVYFLIGEPDDIAFFGRKLFKVKTKKSVVISNILCFLFPCLFIFLGELFVGHVWEWCFGVELWDYNTQPLHITQYTGVLPAVGGGAACYLIIRFAFYPFLRLLKKNLSKKVAVWIACTLGVAILLDTAFISVHSLLFGDAPMYWTVKLR